MFFPRFDGFDPDNTYLRISTNKTRLQCLSSTTGNSHLQYIPRNMHTVFALLCFVVVIHWLIFPYPSGLLHWHCDNLTIVPVPAKQPWWIWINTSCEFIMNDCITTTKQNTTKPCAYFLGYTVCGRRTLNLPARDQFTPELLFMGASFRPRDGSYRGNLPARNRYTWKATHYRVMGRMAECACLGEHAI